MDDEDAAQIKRLVPHSHYQKIHANHVIHMFKPRQFVAAVDAFLLDTTSAGEGARRT
ncbi:hypothetical protein ACFLIM_36010 [Nonomuraea sp. M3C6]|uniref:Uncharacterized protein n=1 Tax=Nonomuraea marmarensis TaxID=3351344 RepID=A0ABW7AMK2_9ACTN